VRGLIVIVALLVVGCSEKKVEVRYIKPHYPRLEVVELNISSIPVVKPDIDVIDGGDSVRLSVVEMLKIQKTLQRCRADRDILLRVYEFYRDEIIRYNKEFVDEKE